LGEKQLLKFAEGCAELAVIEKPPKLEGRRMFMFLTPKAVAKPGVKAGKENKEKE
jgi:translation initiation factor IF-3